MRASVSAIGVGESADARLFVVVVVVGIVGAVAPTSRSRSPVVVVSVITVVVNKAAVADAKDIPDNLIVLFWERKEKGERKNRYAQEQ